MPLLSVFIRNLYNAALFAGLLAPAIMAAALPARAQAAEMPDKTTIRLGVIEGDELEVWQTAAAYAKEKEGLNIVLVPFSDYILPNEALNNGELDANAFQHRPYLEAQIAQRGYKITPAGDTCLYPLGAYSRRVKKLEDLPIGATIGIPDDPSNEGRALRLLAQKGLITLDDPANILVTPINISDNPKNLQFQEMDSGILGRAIGDMDLVIVTNSWVSATGLNPATELIAAESPVNNPYVNFIAVRSEDTGRPWVQKLVASYQNETVRSAIWRVFGNRAITPW
ncbi:MetQ/NlpA family ABC transporter substrate-binding protein [Candidatus Tokpelaia sp.]|uniref:MetQ/NlpA family ABC transporter substrate-binding protein n=1 Tax=Candidatus Tokpelaia sp. TaxID=2233777 RepID=UPI0012387F69|nr:MetQ/NlpA family ABC transporter substrate-binding protein [Candidatus Tokpelaia sp.]KAA6405395.1 metal ABC transporter substrate-binding protein [Candidatus Tokpelaia sp.]